MSEALSFKVNTFTFTSDQQNEVHVNMDVASNPAGGEIVYLFASVGAEDPILVAAGRAGNIDTVVNIAKTRELVDPHRGNKPVPLTAYACWVYTEDQGRDWIAANAAISANAGTLYLA